MRLSIIDLSGGHQPLSVELPSRRSVSDEKPTVSVLIGWSVFRAAKTTSCWSLQLDCLNQKLRGWTMKYLPKKALRDHVPDEILLRRKAGFPVPCYFWLRNDLRKWVTEILLDRKTISVGYFRQDAIEQLLNPPAPACSQFIACTTHDVDFTGIREHKFDHAVWGFESNIRSNVCRSLLF